MGFKDKIILAIFKVLNFRIIYFKVWKFSVQNECFRIERGRWSNLSWIKSNLTSRTSL